MTEMGQALPTVRHAIIVRPFVRGREYLAAIDQQNALIRVQQAGDIVAALDTPAGGLVGCLYVTEEVPLANVAAALDAFLRHKHD